MNFGDTRLLAIFLAYFVPLSLVYYITGAIPKTWHSAPPPQAQWNSRVELGWAVCTAVAIISLSMMYSTGLLFKAKSFNGLGFWLSLLIIWSPLYLLLMWRHQSLSTCYLIGDGLLKKAGWSVFATVLGVTTFLLIEGRLAESFLSTLALTGKRPSAVFQSFLQGAGFGFLLFRVSSAFGKLPTAIACGLLYGGVKYGYFRHELGMTNELAFSVMAFSAVVACGVMWMILKRQDIVVVSTLHIFLDKVQQ